MSIFEVRSTLSHRTLMHRSKYDLARMVLEFADEIDKLRKQLEQKDGLGGRI